MPYEYRVKPNERLVIRRKIKDKSSTSDDCKKRRHPRVSFWDYFIPHPSFPTTLPPKWVTNDMISSRQSSRSSSGDVAKTCIQIIKSPGDDKLDILKNSCTKSDDLAYCNHGLKDVHKHRGKCCRSTGDRSYQCHASPNASINDDDSKPTEAGRTYSFTEDQDQLILKLRREKVSWKDIADELGLNKEGKHEVKKRFVQLLVSKFEAHEIDQERQDDPTDEGKVEEGERAKQAPEQPPDEDTTANKNEVDEAEKALSKLKFCEHHCNLSELQPDERFGQEQIDIMKRIFLQDQKLIWIRLASRFYDETGVRSSPDTIAQKFAVVAGT